MSATEVRRAAEKARRAQDQLEAAVAAMRAEGASLQAIADAAGYSKPGVLKMLRRLES